MTLEGFVVSEGVRIWTIQTGEGYPIMLCNGGAGCCDYLAPVAIMLDDIAQVMRFEQRGCGRSEAVGPYDVESSLSDLENIRKHYKIDRWIIGGHSWGADLALIYALEKPAHVAGLICIAGGRMHNDREWHAEYERRKGEERLPHFAYPPNPEVNKQLNRSWKCYIQKPGVLKAISQVEVPALFVYGESDIRPSWPVEQVANLMPRARFELIKAAEHVIWFSHEGELKWLLRRFVEDVKRIESYQRFLMDAKFYPAISAIKSGNIDHLRELLGQDPSLATARSSRSHPTLLQCLALEALEVPNKVEMAQLLIDGGADVNGALGAAACIDNVEITALLLDRGATVNGTGSWSPLEEALYWNNRRVIDLLLDRGASVRNLRLAAGLGRTDLIESLFESDGRLKPEAGKIDWPFGELEKANCKISDDLQATVAQWSHDPQDIINNAFIYACMHNQIDAARLLLKKGAQINAIPPGFDYAGTGLHYAALNGHRAMVEFLIEQGAKVDVKDTKVNSTPAGWAEHGGHAKLGQMLDQLAKEQNQ